MQEYLTTEAFAKSLGVKPDTIRRRLCVTGSYFGARPRKPPNNRLIWTAEDRDRLLRGEDPSREV
jgi:hypothetical protein